MLSKLYQVGLRCAIGSCFLCSVCVLCAKSCECLRKGWSFRGSESESDPGTQYHASPAACPLLLGRRPSASQGPLCGALRTLSVFYMSPYSKRDPA